MAARKQKQNYGVDYASFAESMMDTSLYGVGDFQINNIIPGPQCAKSGFGGGQYKTTLCTLAKIGS